VVFHSSVIRCNSLIPPPSRPRQVAAKKLAEWIIASDQTPVKVLRLRHSPWLSSPAPRSRGMSARHPLSATPSPPSPATDCGPSQRPALGSPKGSASAPPPARPRTETDFSLFTCDICAICGHRWPPAPLPARRARPALSHALSLVLSEAEGAAEGEANVSPPGRSSSKRNVTTLHVLQSPSDAAT
jgi:hypothetical protein